MNLDDIQRCIRAFCHACDGSGYDSFEDRQCETCWAQVISRFAQVEALCQVEKSEVSLIIFRTMPGVISRMHLQSGQGFLVKQGEQGSSNRAIE